MHLVEEVLETVDLTTTRKKQAGQFSMGMKQRLGIAIALLNHPKLNGTIKFEVKSLDNKINFITTDSGKGFSSEDIKLATKQLCMGDYSRASKIHYGIGLYITESIVKLHGGTLHIANSLVTGGAQVTIEIPTCK
ncbi:hypothetical protein E4K67_23835 [Desulfosporosinus fructosivorans]|uniref:histidine kinase n=1 Tax=Desulfosporosinus fructosivorans TaxID=2018669 RepID=A0A4Z0QYD3_9FIRM|nr:hypothetical protein E4K67_23835 [Desulfosporosinus fructosivorans]